MVCRPSLLARPPASCRAAERLCHRPGQQPLAVGTRVGPHSICDDRCPTVHPADRGPWWNRTSSSPRPSQGAMVSATDIIRGVRPWLDLPVLSVSRAAIRSPRRPWKRSSATSWSARPRWLASFLLRGQRRRQPPHAALPVAESCSRPPSWAKSKRPPVTHVAATLRRHSPADASPGWNTSRPPRGPQAKRHAT